ncbi:hypothetical protein [Amycolatopsis sp. NBC_01480]|uniref:hypothetical protein n=1 Tax=Amycolatopsis sp. NBC_01480 TaxID=2903562 RepID=UPI002E2BE373|nr:hypothetical protein [Amycolatopsis sp. NBC_01480]
MASHRAGRPAPTTATTRRHTTRGRDEQARTHQDSTHTTASSEPAPETNEAVPVARETYAQQQARLDAEAVDRWAVIVVDWPPMTEVQIRALAVILNRIDARQAQQPPGGNRNG